MRQYEDAYDDAWRYERFVTTIQQKAGVSRERAERAAHAMLLDEFVGRIAERDRVDHDEAIEHTRAVIATLREALPPKELSDLLAQLPRGYQEALLKIYEPAR